MVVPAHDAWDDTEFCRDESCTRLELHEKHEIVPLRGRTPKGCPNCLKPLVNLLGQTTTKCLSCGWVRDATKPLASPWVTCPVCRGAGAVTLARTGVNVGCKWCSGTGHMPRLRAAQVGSLQKEKR